MKKLHINTNIDFEIRSGVVKSILLILVILLIMFFVVYPIFVFDGTNTVMNTQTAVKKTVYNTIDVKAFAVRQEVNINNSYTGTIVPAVSDGSKVAIGDTVADIYPDNTSAENAARILQLKDEINYYSSVASSVGSTFRTDLDHYRNTVSADLFSLSQSIENGELSEIADKAHTLRQSIVKKQIAMGAQPEVSPVLDTLKAEYENLKKSTVPASSITADCSGYYVNTSDGYENAADFSSVTDMTMDDVTAALNYTPTAVSSGNVGKLITDFNWYLVCNTTLERLGEIEAGSDVVVTFANSPVDELKMHIEAVNQNTGTDVVTLILRSNIMDEDIADLRIETVKIRVDSFTGLAVDRHALRTVDGVKGVYVKVGNIAEFRKVNIIYSDESFILSSAPEGERGYLELYDEIIPEGVDLYDSKLLN